MLFPSGGSYILTFPIYESGIRSIVIKFVYMGIIQVSFVVSESRDAGCDISRSAVCVIRKVEVYLVPYSVGFELGIQCFHHGSVSVRPTHRFKIALPHDASVTGYMAVRFVERSNLVDTGIVFFLYQVFHHCGEVFGKFFIVIRTGNPPRVNIMASCITQEMHLTAVDT